MPQQIDDQQFYAIKAALDRALNELASAYTILYGPNVSTPTHGASPTTPNTGGKNYSVPPPTVTKDHQASLDDKNPEVQAQRTAEEQVSQANIKSTIGPDVLVISASPNGTGDYFALVQCNSTMQQASIRIEVEEYEELQDVSAEDDVMLTLDQSQIDDAEWEPVRGTSADPQAQCNCNGNVPNANPYNDPKVDAEIASGHTRKCRYWDYNTITYDQQTGRACHVELDKVDASLTYGFDKYHEGRKEILKRAADPDDPIVLVQNDEDTEEFGFQVLLEKASAILGHTVSEIKAVFDDDEDDDDGC